VLDLLIVITDLWLIWFTFVDLTKISGLSCLKSLMDYTTQYYTIVLKLFFIVFIIIIVPWFSCKKVAVAGTDL